MTTYQMATLNLLGYRANRLPLRFDQEDMSGRSV